MLQSAASRYYKVGQEVLQGEKIDITKWERCYKVVQLTFYKVGQSLLQSGAGITKWCDY